MSQRSRCSACSEVSELSEWVTIGRDISLKLYRLLSDCWAINRCVVGRRLVRSPPFREGVEAETFFLPTHLLPARVGRVFRWADLTPVLEADDG